MDGIIVANNHIELSSTTINALRTGIGLYNTGTSPYQNIQINNNYVGWFGDVVPIGGVYNNNFSIGILNSGGGNTNLTGISVVNNQVDPSMYGTFPTNCWLEGNTTTNGTLISVNGFTNTFDYRYIVSSPVQLVQSITGNLTIYDTNYTQLNLDVLGFPGTAFSQQPDGLYIGSAQELNWQVSAAGSGHPNGGTDLSLDGTPGGDFGGTFLFDYSGIGLKFDGQGNGTFMGNSTNIGTNTSAYFVGDGHLINNVIATNLNAAGATAGYYLQYTNSHIQWSPVFSSGTNSSTNGVSGVSALTPLFSSGGSAPQISITGQVAYSNLLITVVTNAVPTNSGPIVRVNAQSWILPTNAPTLGTVTSVTATAPLASSGGSTPAISILVLLELERLFLALMV